MKMSKFARQIMGTLVMAAMLSTGAFGVFGQGKGQDKRPDKKPVKVIDGKGGGGGGKPSNPPPRPPRDDRGDKKRP